LSLQLPQVPQVSGVNWKAILFWAIILGLIFAAVYWFYGPEILAFLNIGAIPDIEFLNFDGALTGVMDYVNKNPISVVVGGIGVLTAGIALYERVGKVRADTARQEIELQKIQLESAASEQIKQANATADGYKYQYEQAIQNTNTDALKEATDLVSKLQHEKTSLVNQNQALMDKLASTPVKVVKVVK